MSAREFRHDIRPSEVFDSLRHPDDRVRVLSVVHCNNPTGWPSALVNPSNDLVRCRRPHPPLHPALFGRPAASRTPERQAKDDVGVHAIGWTSVIHPACDSSGATWPLVMEIDASGGADAVRAARDIRGIGFKDRH